MTLLILVILFFISSPVFAINIETPVVKTDIGEFTVEKYITFSEYIFDSSVPYPPIEIEKHNNSTPEKAVISFLSAINSLNVQWFLSCWEPESRKVLEEKFSNEETKEKYLKGWKEQLSFEYIYFRRIIDRGNHIIFEYDYQKKGKEKHKGIINLVKINDFWFASRSFSNDLIYMYYTSGKKSIRLPEEDFDSYYLEKAKSELTKKSSGWK